MRIKPILIALSVLLVVSCSSLIRPQKGGGATVSPVATKSFNGQINPPTIDSMGMPAATITQPDNPNSSSSQAVNYDYEETTIVSVDTVKETVTNYPDGRSVTIKEPIPSGSRIVKKSKSSVNQAVGGSWKDTAREVSAALGSFQAVQYAGIFVMLAGAVGFFHPVLRTIIGGKDVAMVVAACGAIMMFGPYLLVQYSKFFFLAILLAAGYWVIARFKYQHGKLDTLESQQAK